MVALVAEIENELDAMVALQDASADDFIYVGGSSYIVTDFLSFE